MDIVNTNTVSCTLNGPVSLSSVQAIQLRSWAMYIKARILSST